MITATSAICCDGIGAINFDHIFTKYLAVFFIANNILINKLLLNIILNKLYYKLKCSVADTYNTVFNSRVIPTKTVHFTDWFAL